MATADVIADALRIRSVALPLVGVLWTGYWMPMRMGMHAAIVLRPLLHYNIWHNCSFMAICKLHCHPRSSPLDLALVWLCQVHTHCVMCVRCHF